jgi:hypothetical protein
MVGDAGAGADGFLNKNSREGREGAKKSAKISAPARRAIYHLIRRSNLIVSN